MSPRRERRGLAEHGQDDAAVLVAADQLAGAADRGDRAAQVAVQRACCAHLAPAELEQVVGREVGRERLADRSADARQVQQRARRGQAVGDRLQDALLAQPAREVVVGRVGGVLAHARVGQRVAAVEVQPAAPEAPGVAVEAVRDDLLGVVDRDAPERVDELAEAREVDQHDVVDRDARERLHGLDRERGAAERVGDVDAIVAVARDRHAQVARDRQLRDAVGARVDAHEQDRVGAPGAAVRAPVGAEHERGRGVGEQRAPGRQRGARAGVDALVGGVERAAELPVAVADPEQRARAGRRAPRARSGATAAAVALDASAAAATVASRAGPAARPRAARRLRGAPAADPVAWAGEERGFLGRWRCRRHHGRPGRPPPAPARARSSIGSAASSPRPR